MKVLKFGGTSVGTPDRMRHVAGLIKDKQDIVVVLSAVAKTTDRLVEISRLLAGQPGEAAIEAINALHSQYEEFVQALFTTEAGRAKGRQLIETHFTFIRTFTRDIFTISEERAILARGELLSSSLLHFFLEESGTPSVLLPALEFMRLNENGEPDTGYIQKKLTTMMKEFAGSRLFITQGYICRNARGEIDNLKRGGSDYSASLVGAALRCEEVQIWTDIDGMHNSDPRYVKKTRPIRELSFDEAAELAYFGAKILHPSSILPAQRLNIPVRLLNTLQPHAPGTLITARTGKGKIKAVAAKDGITAIKIKSSRMLLAYGFLRRVFEVFELYKTPIDMITTSEIAVSLTIDNPTYLEAITRDLAEFGAVEVDQNLTIICVVGDFVAENKGVALQVIQSLKNIPLRMISYGGSRHNISLLIPGDMKIRALNALHKGLFNAGDKINYDR